MGLLLCRKASAVRLRPYAFPMPRKIRKYKSLSIFSTVNHSSSPHRSDGHRVYSAGDTGAARFLTSAVFALALRRPLIPASVNCSGGCPSSHGQEMSSSPADCAKVIACTVSRARNLRVANRTCRLIMFSVRCVCSLISGIVQPCTISPRTTCSRSVSQGGLTALPLALTPGTVSACDRQCQPAWGERPTRRTGRRGRPPPGKTKVLTPQRLRDD